MNETQVPGEVMSVMSVVIGPDVGGAVLSIITDYVK